MFELRPISNEAIPRAIAKAERYRLLNEPQEAESICRDVLKVDPDNQDVLIMLLLALTDEFAHGSEVGVDGAQEVLRKLRGEYERAYYAGIVCERWVKAQLKGGARSGNVSGWLLEAMDWYEKAQRLSPPGNDDAILRWNACVRFLERNRDVLPVAEQGGEEAGFSDGSPLR